MFNRLKRTFIMWSNLTWRGDVFTPWRVKTTRYLRSKNYSKKWSKKGIKIYSKKGVVLYLFYLLHFWSQFDSSKLTVFPSRRMAFAPNIFADIFLIRKTYLCYGHIYYGHLFYADPTLIRPPLQYRHNSTTDIFQIQIYISLIPTSF
jgi:hypothetical protein